MRRAKRIPFDWDAAHARIEEVFDAWVLAARDAESTLCAWSASATDERADAYVTYCAALDREERAAQVLAAAAARDGLETVIQPATRSALTPWQHSSTRIRSACTGAPSQAATGTERLAGAARPDVVEQLLRAQSRPSLRVDQIVGQHGDGGERRPRLFAGQVGREDESVGRVTDDRLLGGP
jgi:hypothetical protein